MKKENIVMIAAYAKNKTIGDGEKMLWHIPKDFQWFKEKTIGHNVVMGRRTMENILTYTKGKPLPQRKNIVLSRSANDKEGFTFISSIEEVLTLSDKEKIIIIGGANIYEQFLPYAGTLIITQINKDIEGKAKFPNFNQNEFYIKFNKNESENGLEFEFIIYERK